jgi:hypothetical protein
MRALPKLIVLGCLLLSRDASAQATVVQCAQDIAGTVIDFEHPAAATVNDVLPGYGMIAIADAPVADLVFWVVGNACAPITGRAGFSDVEVRTTGLPWTKVGMSLVGTSLTNERTIVMVALGAEAETLGVEAGTFVPGSSQQDFNDAALFMGFESPVPIHSFRLSAVGSNFAWDEIRFVHAGTTPAPRRSWGAVKLIYRRP